MMHKNTNHREESYSVTDTNNQLEQHSAIN